MKLKDSKVLRAFVRDVVTPLVQEFPAPDEEIGFADGRSHSFRHFFCSTCANNNVPGQMVMWWLGHRSREMVRHYYHLHDDELEFDLETGFLIAPPTLPTIPMVFAVRGGRGGRSPLRHP